METAVTAQFCKHCCTSKLCQQLVCGWKWVVFSPDTVIQVCEVYTQPDSVFLLFGHNDYRCTPVNWCSHRTDHIQVMQAF